MEKYLKIQGSIRLTIRLMLLIFITLIATSTYLLIFYAEIKKTLNILQYDIINSVGLPILIWVIVVSLLSIVLMYYIFRYRRWAIILVLILISLPLAIASIGWLWYMIWRLDEFGFENIDDSNRVTILLSFVAMLIFVWITTRACTDLIKLFKNIKNPTKLSRDLITEIKPGFMGIFMITILPFITLGWFLVLLYNPITPIEYNEWYLNMEWFDLDNPTYTDPNICSEFESVMRQFQDVGINNRFYGGSTNTGIILAKNALLTETNKGMIFGWNLEASNDASAAPEGESAQSKLSEYISANPKVWREDLKILRKNLTEESVTKIQSTIDNIPNNIRCNVRDDSSIATELSPSLITFLKVSRLLNFAIELSLLEWNSDEAINILKSFHEYDTKFYNSNNLSFVWWMIGTAMIRKEFKSVESIVGYANTSQMSELRDIYITPFDTAKNEITAWKWEYYRVNHLITDRRGTMDELSLPYFFNGKDMIERMMILVYLPSIANINKDALMQEKIDKNLVQNKKNIISPAEWAITGNKNLGWRSKFPFYMIYNPIWKNLMYPYLNTASSDFKKYHEKYRGSALYQNYIRYNLLGIEKK